MSILKIACMGHPVLREKAHAVDPSKIRTPLIQQLIDNMIVTMGEYAGVGLAAAQIHYPSRLFVTNVPVDRGDRSNAEVIVLFNPEISAVGNEFVEDWERCASVPGICGLVRRASKVAVSGLDRKGQRIEFHAEDLAARVLQHEYDHLDGVLFLDRMESMQSLAFIEHVSKRVPVL